MNAPSMTIETVSTVRHAQIFLQMPAAIYADFPNYIRPLDKDIDEVFDKTKNKAFRHGTVCRWLLFDSEGRVLGRIAAFTNKRYKNKGDDVPVGGVGFFECNNNQQAANLLFDAAKQWLINQGIQTMDGPINFGERDKWWGLLTKGFQSPLYCMNYNPPYYQQLFEGYGFQLFFKQICFGMLPHEQLQPKFLERHARIAGDPALSARHIRKSQLNEFAADFHVVYNKAWAGHGGNKELSLEQCRKIFLQMKPVMDEKIVWFAYYGKDPIAIFINLPDLNQWFKFLNGKFGLLQKLRFLLIKAIRKNPRFVGVVFGIVPDWQGKGIDSYIIVESAKVIQKNLQYEEYEMQWIGDFNPKMIALAENLTPTRSRELATYRYNFDREKPFTRHPML
jgi:ribosomal protein L13